MANSSSLLTSFSENDCEKYFRFKTGGQYTGDYANGRKHGQGTFVYPDGSRYVGNWINDEKHGTGTYYYPNGDVYEGEWSQNQRHGQGVYTYKETGTRYQGSWRNGKMEESGDLIHANHLYVGTFEGNLPHGRGKYIFDHGCES